MVATPASNRKYLCAAPRPDCWDDYVEDVLKNLGKTNAEREAVLRETLTKTKAMNPFVAKSGPGRKSNAEHAIHFYEYLLKKLKSTEEGKIRIDVPSDDDEDQEEDEREADINDSAGKQVSQEGAAGGENSSLDTELFNAQHNDFCEVCDEGGELLMCSTCNLVFHLACYRPILQTVPTEKNWRCSYCILSTEPKNSKPRKQAAAAVRLMARLRNQSRRKKASEEDDDIAADLCGEKKKKGKGEKGDRPESDAKAEKAPKKAMTPVDPEKGETKAMNRERAILSTPTRQRDVSSDDDEGKANSSSQKKRELALSKLSNSLSPNGDNLEDSGRGKRARRQPTLYDPQAGPARKWQSAAEASQQDKEKVDQDNKEKTEDEDTAADEGKEQSTPHRRGHRDIGDGVWCGFCGDDPSIKVCCFCACRICFGKHHQNKLLLCDRCDDEYHTFCLDPQLDTMQKSSTWYCPTCISSEEKRSARSTSRVGTRGHVKKEDEEEEVSPRRASSRKPAQAVEETQEETPALARLRGRPPKTVVPSEESRKRGRPPKSSAESPAPPRKRGRPALSRSPSQSSSKSRDVTDKVVATSSTMDKCDAVLEVEVAAPETHQSIGQSAIRSESISIPVTVSRSGRTVKRSTFHDEISLGEQHLRTSRLASEQQRRSTWSASERQIEPEDPIEEKKIQTLLVASASTSKLVETISSAPTRSQGAIDPPAAGPRQTQIGDDIPRLSADTTKAATAKKDPPESDSKVVQAESKEPETKEANKKLSDAVASAGPVMDDVDTAMAEVTRRQADEASISAEDGAAKESKAPRRKPGARECMQISRRFGVGVIPERYMDILLDYCKRGKVEHLIRMRERLDDHARFLESQLAGLEMLVQERGESDVVVPPVPQGPDARLERAMMDNN